MKTMMLAASAALAIAMGAAPAALANDTSATAPAKGTANIVATAKANSEFSTLSKAIEASGLTDELAAAGPYTMFAPTDAAFGKLPPDKLASLMDPANKEELKQLLQNHVVSGQAKAEFFAGKSGEMTALGGGKLALNGADGVSVNGAKVVQADIAASNGIVHAIDSVMLPETGAVAAAPAADEAEEGSSDK